MGTLGQDLSSSLRSLLKAPAFTAVVTLALGVGANSAIFSVLDAVLLRPLPFPHAERVVSVAWARGRSRWSSRSRTRTEAGCRAATFSLFLGHVHSQQRGITR